MIKFTLHVLTSCALYPVTMCYVLAVVLMQLIATGSISLAYGVLALGVAAVIIILSTIKREMDLVRDLMLAEWDLWVKEHDEVHDQIEHLVTLFESDLESGAES